MALFHAARVGLGALGIITAVTFLVEPAFTLDAVEEPMGWDETVGGFDEIVAANHHVDMYWFPHTDRALVKRNDRVPTDSELDPVPRWRNWLEGELLSNVVYEGINRVASWRPAAAARRPPRGAQTMTL